MKKFMDQDFLLDSAAAKTLYESVRDLPIIDYHCHIDPREICEDKTYDNVAQLWLGVGGSNFGDHYKWRFMRSCGIEERYITGTEPDEERFVKWAECLSHAIGNPLYHWSHMELRKYFGFEGYLNGENAREVYRLCNEKLRQEHLSVRGIVERSGVQLICTTDDPADSLEWHAQLRADESFSVQVLPAMRPDKAKGIEKPDYPAYLAKLSAAAGVQIMLFVGEEYSRRGWVMQLHYGAKRDNNTGMFERLGPDTGYDCVSNYAPSALLADFLNALERGGHLPKTILYSLNTNDNAAIDSVIGCFQNSDAVAKIQHGSAWWFNDHIQGITEQMVSLANLGNLSGFVGMLTDSRSFLSYTRHDYFRRILCSLLGGWVERGEYPDDWATLRQIARNISYNNAVRYFGFALPVE